MNIGFNLNQYNKVQSNNPKLLSFQAARIGENRKLTLKDDNIHKVFDAAANKYAGRIRRLEQSGIDILACTDKGKFLNSYRMVVKGGIEHLSYQGKEVLLKYDKALPIEVALHDFINFAEAIVLRADSFIS